MLTFGILWIRSLRDERNAAPLPRGAKVRSIREDLRRSLVRLPLWIAFLAAGVLVLGTYGAGIALGASLASPVWLSLLRRWETKRNVEIFVLEDHRLWRRRKDPPYYYVKRLSRES
jgi:hypothetical protein